MLLLLYQFISSNIYVPGVFSGFICQLICIWFLKWVFQNILALPKPPSRMYQDGANPVGLTSSQARSACACTCGRAPTTPASPGGAPVRGAGRQHHVSRPCSRPDRQVGVMDGGGYFISAWCGNAVYLNYDIFLKKTKLLKWESKKSWIEK